MAIYRSDQAQLTFGVEAAPGGYREVAVTSTLTGDRVTSAAYSAGTTAITLAAGSMSGYEAGVIVCIGTTSSLGITVVPQEHRKIVHAEGQTIYLDAPLGFSHPTATKVQLSGANDITDSDTGKFITLIPGVYETVDTPDPTMALEGRYFLGTEARRNFFAAYKGQQSYVGSVPGFVLLDGRALRFPIGKTVTECTAVTNRTHLVVNDYSVAPSKGDLFIKVADASSIAVDSLIGIDTGTGTPPNTGAVSGSNAGRHYPDVGEVRTVVSKATNVIRLDYPLSFDHKVDLNSGTASTAQITNATGPFFHHIFETVDLDTVSWHLHMRDSSELSTNDFDRRWYGGKIGSATLSADEGGMVTYSWDGVNFMGMVTNQEKGNALGNADIVPFYSKMQKIETDEVVFPTTEPYYFSEGAITLFGQELARVRHFSLSIANNEEPRYYIQRRYGRQRGPTEIMEQRREYSLSMSVALPDATARDSTTTRLFNELLWEGDYGSGMQGVNITLRFDRGADDYILITIPDDGTSATGGNQQGAFIRSAAHAITGDNPLQVDVDAFFRNIKIEVKDSVSYYP